MKYIFTIFVLMGLLVPSLIRAETTDVRPTRKVRQVIKETKAVLIGATVTAKDATTLTVSKDSKSYTVDVSTAKMRRRFWGNSSIAEIQINDTVSIHGRYTNEAKTTIKAITVRDLSIQKRPMVRIGEVKSTTTTGFMMSGGDADYAVTVGSAKMVNRKQETIVLTDILAGHKVRVHGIWDSANHTVTEVKQVKDFSLPVKPTPTAQ